LGTFSFSTFLSPAGFLGTPGLMFPQGTRRIYATVPYQNVRANALFEERWYRDGKLWISRQATWETWAKGAMGTLITESIYLDEGLEAGHYRVEIWLDGQLAQTGYFLILSNAPTPTITATPTSTATSSPTPTATRTPIPTATPSPTLSLAGRLRLAYRSTVYISTPKDGGERPSVGTGCVVDGRGLILTVLHLVADPWSGVPHNRAGRIEVGVSDDPLTEPVQMRYLAQVVATNRALGLAILYVKSDVQGNPLPRAFSLPAARLGDDRNLASAADIHLCGYPDTGDGTAVAVPGLYTGHSEDKLWIQFVAPHIDGYNGGIALNDKVEFVGIVYGVRRPDHDAGAAWYYLRPINAAKPLIAQAQRWLDSGLTR